MCVCVCVDGPCWSRTAGLSSAPTRWLDVSVRSRVCMCVYVWMDLVGLVQRVFLLHRRVG